MEFRVYSWRGQSFLFGPGRVLAVGTFDAVEELSKEEYEAWQEMLIDAIRGETGRN